jgi:Protein of unknown function (DUF3055)
MKRDTGRAVAILVLKENTLSCFMQSPLLFDKMNKIAFQLGLNRGRNFEMTERFFLYDDLVNTKTRFVSFMGENQRFDLAIIQSDRYYGKMLVLDIQGNRFAIIGHDDLDEEGYLEHAFKLSEEDAEELRSFLREMV